MIDNVGVLIAGAVGFIALIVDWYVNLRVTKSKPSYKQPGSKAK